VISAWTLTEMASVGGIKQRTGAIDAATRQQALAHFQRFVSAELRTVEVEPADFRTAPCSSTRRWRCARVMRCTWRSHTGSAPGWRVSTAG
jgi:hypothetical protein